MKILVINDIANYHTQAKQHFSLTKGYYFAKGLSKINNNQVYFLTTGENSNDDKLIFLNDKELNQEFLKDLNLMLLIRENNFLDILNTYPDIRKWIFDEGRDNNKKLAIKSDSLSWVYSPHYLKNFRLKYNQHWVEFVAKFFDILFVQTKEFKDYSVKIIQQRFGGNLANILRKKIFISRMGVPNQLPHDFKNLKNPYDINHSYCLDNYYKLKPNLALHSLPFTLKNRAQNNNPITEYNKEKTILIYMGRIKVDGGKILYMMRDIMKELGNDYELHIFPGRFELPDIGVKVWSPKYMDNLQTLRDYIFGSCSNVIIHVPFDDKTKTQWVQYADIGIDFASSRPANRKSYAGHAKVLEYCYYGLKVVCERNICNSHLVKNANNGILLNGIGTIEQYVTAIREIKNKEINKLNASKMTIKDSNWDKISEEFYNFLLNKSETK